MKSYLLILLTLLLVISINAKSQNKNAIGLNTSIESSFHSNFRMLTGITYEYQLSKNSSFEIGLTYRSFLNDLSKNNSSHLLFINASSILEKYMTIPITYKYNLKYLNISFGPTFDFYLGYDDKSSKGNEWVYSSYKLDHKVYYGVIGKISKAFNVGNKIVIEPEIKYNQILTPYSLFSNTVPMKNREYIGLGVTTKFRF